MPGNDTRPVNLELFKFHFPITAWASISHRVAAVISWFALGVGIAAFYYVSQSSVHLVHATNLLNDNFMIQFVAWGLLSAFGYYCVGTVKHIIQDMGYCEEFESGKKISWASILLGVAISIMLGVYLWA